MQKPLSTCFFAENLLGYILTYNESNSIKKTGILNYSITNIKTRLSLVDWAYKLIDWKYHDSKITNNDISPLLKIREAM